MNIASELASYGLIAWLAFSAIAFCSAYSDPWWCIISGQIVVGVIVAILDVRLVRSAMNQPGWNGVPDMDIVFSFGVMIRVLLINFLLLPITGAGYGAKLGMRHFRRRP